MMIILLASADILISSHVSPLIHDPVPYVYDYPIAKSQEEQEEQEQVILTPDDPVFVYAKQMIASTHDADIHVWEYG